LITGHYLLPSTTTSAPVPEPYKNTNALWPTLFGDRVVGTPDQHQTWVQDASSIGSTTFNGWIDFTGVTGFNLHRTDVAATGNVIAAELDQFGPPEIMKIAMVPVSIQNLTLGAGDCFLNTDALPRYPSLSQDGTLIAWSDAGGVKVGGVPDFSGADPCVLTKPAITISPTGSYPSVGPFNVAAISKTPAPVAPPTLTAPKTQKLKDFAKTGLLLKIGFAAGGKATANVTVLPKTIGKKGKKAIVIASGSVTLPAGGALKILKLKLNSKGKSLAKKLKGKKVTITVTVGGSTTTQSLKLK
jgi:hypothetical protein